MIHARGIVIFKIADQKIIEGWLSADMLGLLQQIGLLSLQTERDFEIKVFTGSKSGINLPPSF